MLICRDGVVLSGEQPFELPRIRARHFEYFHPASRPCHQADRVAPDTERRSHRCQRSRGRLPVHGSLTDPDDQSSVVFPAYTGVGGSGPHPDSNTHVTSVPGKPRDALAVLSPRLSQPPA